MKKSREDELKVLRIEQENQFIDINFVEELAGKVTADLLVWANENIFAPLGGELSLTVPTFGSPNARAITYLDKPYRPSIEIRLSMFQEIYRDAFTFPLISKRIETETATISDFHKAFICPYDNRYMFSTGVPEIPAESTQGILRPYFLAFSKIIEEKPNEKMECNDLACRFVMFEIVVAWIFFHELGHLIQRHYMLKEVVGKDSGVLEIFEIDENKKERSPDISGQAREVMADIEGLDLTLRYMKRKGILQPQSMYLLLCGVSCMYQRFYSGYEDNLNLSAGTHPHPVVRNEYFHNYLLQWMLQFLNGDKSKAALPLTYISVRSSLMAGLFWAHRVEKFDGDGLPTYMDLSSQRFESQRDAYMNSIKSEVIKTISIVKCIHMTPLNSISLFEKSLTNRS